MSSTCFEIVDFDTKWNETYLHKQCGFFQGRQIDAEESKMQKYTFMSCARASKYVWFYTGECRREANRSHIELAYFRTQVNINGKTREQTYRQDAYRR